MEKEWPANGGPEDVSQLRREASDVETAPERLIELSADSELRLLVAANVSTSAAHLEELSKDESEQVRRAVAQNPNVSLPCLLALANEFPAEFFLNPLCSLLNLAQPGWYTQIEDLTWLSLLRYAQIPRSWLSRVEEQKRHKGILTNLGARQPRDPYRVWVAARLHVALPELHANGEHIGRDLADSVAVVARHGRTPGPLLAELASIVCQYGHVKEIGDAVCELIRRSVARNVAAPEDVLRILARDVDPKVRYRVGENPRTPVDVLEQLAADTLAYVRSGVSANPATPPALLEHLAFNKSYEEKYEQIIRQREPEESNEFKKPANVCLSGRFG